MPATKMSPVGVAHRVDVDLDGVFEEAVEQDRSTLRHATLAREGTSRAGQVRHDPLEGDVVVDDLHGAPAQHVARTHEDGVADVLDDRLGLGQRVSATSPGGWRSPIAVTDLPTTARGPRRCRWPPPGVPSTRAGSMTVRQLQRRLAAQRHDHADAPARRRRRRPAPRRSPRPRPRGSGARSRDGPRSNSRSRRSRDCS